MVRDQHGGDAPVPQRPGDGFLPELDGPPGAPGEVEGTDQDVVAGRHAGQRARMMAGESEGGLGESPQSGGLELLVAVGLEQMAVEAVQQHDDQIGRVPFCHASLPGDPVDEERLGPATDRGQGPGTGAEAGVVTGGTVVGSSLVESTTPLVCLL